MRADVKRDLIAALRSTLYRQILYQLRGAHPRDHCALGVLDELHHQAGHGPRHHGDFLPQDVLRWAELSVTGAEKIAALNNAGVTFPDLADLLGRTDDEDDLPPPYAMALAPERPKPPRLDAVAAAPRREMVKAD